MSYVEYDSNNSGGDWWLEDEDWYALEEAGWKVHLKQLIRDGVGEDGLPVLREVRKDDDRLHHMFVDMLQDDRFLGALATSAYRTGLTLEEAVAEWERVTGESSTDAGCPCCGPPHYFRLVDDEGRTVRSGPETQYTASW